MIIDIIGRIIALLVIAFGVGIVLVVLGFEDLADSIENNENIVIEYLIEYIFIVVYYTLFETFTQQSIGKMITQTKVVKLDGSKPEAFDIFRRSLSRIVPFEPFSFLGSSLTGWHDDWTDTVVIDLKKYDPNGDSNILLDEIGKREEE